MLILILSTIYGKTFAQLSISDVNTTYTVDFDNTLAGVNNSQFAGTGFTPAPTTGRLDSDAWEVLGLSDGALNFGDSQSAGDFARGSSSGGETTGGIYAFDVGGNNFAWGVQPTGSDWFPNGSITLRIQNNSGQTIKGLRVNYTIFELNNADRATNFNFAYSTDNIVYSDIPALNHTTTELAGLAIWLAAPKSTDIQGIDVAPGDFFYIRWQGSDAGGTGSRDEIALDNIQIQVISSLMYSAGDWRPLADNVGLDDANQWEFFNGTTWVAQTNSPETSPTTPTRLIIDRAGITAGNSNTITYNSIFILAGGSLIVDVDDATIADNSNPLDFIGPGDVLEVQNLGTLIVEGDLGLNPSAQLIVKNGALITLNQASFSNQHPFWDGTEDFENGSTLEVRNWNWTAATAQRSLLNATPQVSDNAEGYKFGNLTLILNPLAAFDLVDGQQGSAGNPFRLVENDLSINNNSLAQFVSINSSATDSYFSIHGSLLINEGLVNLFNSGTAVSHTLHITNDFTVGGGSLVQLSGNANNTAIVFLKGDLSATAGTTFTSLNTNSELNFNGVATQTLNLVPNASNIDFLVNNGASVQLITQNLKFNGNCSMTVQTGGAFNFGFNGTTALEIEQVGGSANSFTSQTGSTLRISSPNGISITSDSNVKGIPAGNRNFSQTATFIYIGRSTFQVTGDGLGSGSTAKTVIVDANTNTTLFIGPTNTQIGISSGGRLEIRRGIFSVPAGFSVSGSGDLTMTGGELQLGESSSTLLPELNGTYTLTGGVINLFGADQILRGGRDYHSLTFSNAGTKTLSSALPASSLEGTLQILDDAVLDIEDWNFDGTGTILMDNNARLRISRLNTTLPQLTGTYTMNGNSTLELYGTQATQQQSLRGGQVYNRVEINALEANELSGEANVITNSSFSVKGAFIVNEPATFQIASGFTLSGTGGSSFELRDRAGLKYGSADGIAGTGAIGNIQTTSRSFSNDADYYLVGGVEQLTGNGLPAVVRKLILDKTANNASLSQDVQVSQEVRIVSEDLNLNGHNITLDASAFLNEDRANNHVVFDTSAAQGGDGLIIASGRSYDETSLATDISGLGLHLQRNTAGGSVVIDISRGHQRLGIANKGIRKSFQITTVSGSVDETTMQFYYADDDFTGITDFVGEEASFSLSRFTSSWTDGLGAVDVANNFVQYNQVKGFSTWTITTFDFPLPVTLLSLKVDVVSNHEAQLIWKTTQELNNQGFGIEKSLDGKVYETMAFVETSSEQGAIKEYAFTDQAFYESAYYRLGQTDLDGKVNYSPAVFAEHPGTSVLNIYPNPFTEKVNISWKTTEPVRILLLDLQGQIHWEAYGELENLNHTLNQFLQNIPSGTYLIRLESPQKSIVRKIIKD